MASTLLLDQTDWDLVVDLDGNIAKATEPYSQAQDAASAIRLFKGELWFDTSRGIDYFGLVLGKIPPLSLVKALMNAAALTVPGVVTAKTFVNSWTNRVFTGQVQITNSDDDVSAAGF